MSDTTSLLVLSLALVAGASLCACSKPAPAKSAEAPLTVTTAVVTARPLAGGLTASGNLMSREEAGVASELAGYRVAEVDADEGDWVKQGQPLAKLDDTLLRSQMAQAQANLVQQQVAGQRCQQEADRVKGLDNAGVLSQEQIIERRLQAKSGQAGVQAAKAQLDDLKTRDAKMIIRAPVAGRVLERDARPGDASSLSHHPLPHRPRRPGGVQRGGLPGRPRQHPGRRAVEVDLPSDAKVTGHVRFISPRVDAATGLGHVRVALPVREDLRPGGFARGVFETTAHPVPVVPESAIHFDANGASVMVIDADDRVHRAAIQTGQRGAGLVQLVQGPPVGARVALGGGAFVLDGDKVQVVGERGPSGNSGGAS